ncbi:MAG: fibronectin type III domain-containing protein [Minisyncoccia bacterium]
MNKIISKTIRVMVITGVALFAFTGEVFAAPTFLPTSSLEITNTSAVVRVYIENPNELAVVWFEWSEASSVIPPEVIAMSNYFGSGFFAARLPDLKPGTTYSYRAAAKSGGATVYSPTASFKTTGAAPVTTTTISSQAALGGAPLSGGSVNADTTSQVSSGSTQAQPVASQAARSTIKTATVKNSASVASSDSAKSDTSKLGANNNTASVAGAGSELLPSTLIGWVALIVVILFVVLIIVMIFESTERRKKVRVMKKENGEEVLIEE